MPLYEYQCKKCKHRFEQIQKFSDKPIKKCPKCGGPLEKLISASAVQFKGSGWYVSDYGKGSSGKSSSSSSESDGGSKDSKDSKDSSKESSKDSKESKDTKETKDSKKDDKPKSDTSARKNKKD
ncbi:MAG: zinc ribbon domain-containing protein [Terriglobales bacterium]|jgi:putative FmdB family regulatory protein